jgi:hypothetical protein
VGEPTAIFILIIVVSIQKRGRSSLKRKKEGRNRKTN